MFRVILFQTVHYLFLTYTILLLIRILGSWVPSWRYSKFFHFVAFYTDPYLNLFRRIIPPIGGVLDLSPILAFFVLRLAEGIILGLIR